MNERKKELDSLIYGFLVKEKCFETAAYFLHDIKYQVESDVIESGVKLEDVFMEFSKNDSQQNTSGRGHKRKVKEIASAKNNFDSDSNKSDTASTKRGTQNVVLQSAKEIFGADLTQRKVSSNRKRIDLELFREYKYHFGDLRVPIMYTVPYEDSWSHKYHGANLGAVVHSIRISLKANKLDYCEEEMSELLEMGFIPDAHRDKDERIVLAFQLFIAKYGHADVPRMFIIRKDDESWPEELRGLNLGTILNNIRNTAGAHREIHQELLDIGIDLTAQIRTLTSEQVHEILLIYKKIHGNVDMKYNYVVPESPDYPEYAWGYALGRCVNENIKTGGHAQYNKQWEALGIEIKHKIVNTKDVSFDEICEAIECYQAIHGHLNMSQQFVVPPDATFPPHLHGIRLGKIVYDMRAKGSYAQHKDRLAQLGVVVAKRAVNVEQLVG